MSTQHLAETIFKRVAIAVALAARDESPDRVVFIIHESMSTTAAWAAAAPLPGCPDLRCCVLGPSEVTASIAGWAGRFPSLAEELAKPHRRGKRRIAVIAAGHPLVGHVAIDPATTPRDIDAMKDAYAAIAVDFLGTIPADRVIVIVTADVQGGPFATAWNMGISLDDHDEVRAVAIDRAQLRDNALAGGGLAPTVIDALASPAPSPTHLVLTILGGETLLSAYARGSVLTH